MSLIFLVYNVVIWAELIQISAQTQVVSLAKVLLVRKLFPKLIYLNRVLMVST